VWLKDCYDYVVESESLNHSKDMDKIIRMVEQQLLHSDLSDSMMSGTGLPGSVSDGMTLKGSPILVEITSITEIGNSAYSLLNVRQAIIDKADLAGLGDEEDDGKVTKYPRSMLQLEITDGTTIMKAIEFRKLPELVLGETHLGCKVILYGIHKLLTSFNPLITAALHSYS